MISAEQIKAIDEAIVFLTHDNPGCRLHVELDEIGVDTADGDYREYDVYHAEYKTELCLMCGETLAPSDMGDNGECLSCEEDEDDVPA